MGSVFTVAVGIAGWSVGFIKDIHFRGMHINSNNVSFTYAALVTVDM